MLTQSLPMQALPIQMLPSQKIEEIGPTPPPGFFTAFKASEKGWCFIKRTAPDECVSKTGQVLIRVHADGRPRI